MGVLNKVKKYSSENRWFLVFIIITAVLMFFSIVWVYHVKVLNAPKVYSDGFGYYLYLPAIIHGDFSFSFIEGWEHPFALKQVAGGAIDKYPVGVAILESPFFFLAHGISLVRDMVTGSATASGYSNLYQYMVLFGGIFYWIVGTMLLHGVLRRYLGFSSKVSLSACVVITYGTNLFHYASYDACFSHIYSYFLFNLFLWYLCWYEERDKKRKNTVAHTCLFGLIAGLIFMCRNTNVVFVVLYVFYGVTNWETLKKRMLTILKPSRAVPIVLTGITTLFPQLLYWYSQTGHWIVYSYGDDEPFYWLAPEVGNFLFSVRKGLFFWSPVLLLAVVGIFAAYRKRRQLDTLYTGLVVFFALIVYISSAWWCWYYAGSFGQRVAVDFMCLFAIFIAVVFERVETGKRQGKKGQKLLGALVYSYCGICILWNLLCMTAYWYRVLPSDGADWETVRQIAEMII